jgi:hypothetical protein
MSRTKDMKKMEQRESSVLCIVACATALEAKANELLANDGRLPAYDDLRLRSKVETIAHWAGDVVNWGAQPWNEIGRLLRIRNWLIHYREAELGLVNTRMEWVKDGHHKPPRLDPIEELTMDRVAKYYRSVREAMLLLSKWMKLHDFEYQYLEKEDYCAFFLD